MAVRRIDDIIDVGGRNFSFWMTNHLQDRTPSGITSACNTIANWIIENENAGAIAFSFVLNWFREFGGNLDFRICPILPTNVLWDFLDLVSKRETVNWLIFGYWPDATWVTHFGPFGIKKGHKFESKWNETCKLFDNEMKKITGVTDISKCTPKQKKAAETELKKHIEANYMKAKNKIESAIEIQKKIMSDIIREVCGTEEGKAIMTQLETALSFSVAKEVSEFEMKKVAGVISKEIVTEIAEDTAKIVAKEVPKDAAKEIPVIGFLIGAGFGIWRSVHGDFGGAALEIASGAASTIPGVGTVASLGVDALLAAKDIAKAVSKLQQLQSQVEKTSNEIELLIDQQKTLEEQHNLIKKVFFESGFNFKENGEEFGQAFIDLVDIILP